jgi:hypothetical protein
MCCCDHTTAADLKRQQMRQSWKRKRYKYPSSGMHLTDWLTRWVPLVASRAVHRTTTLPHVGSDVVIVDVPATDYSSIHQSRTSPTKDTFTRGFLPSSSESLVRLVNVFLFFVSSISPPPHCVVDCDQSCLLFATIKSILPHFHPQYCPRSFSSTDNEDGRHKYYRTTIANNWYDL